MPFTPVRDETEYLSTAGLKGVRVIVTRPRHQCDRLIAMLAQRGAYARCLPVVEIQAPPDVGAAIKALSHLSRFDRVIFTSANAVGGALSLEPDLPRASGFPEVAAVGPATRRVLEQAGIPVAITPETEFSSEGLLRHPRLVASAIRGKRILIVKGSGGRRLLADGLEAAGASVVSVDVYRRSRPEGKISELLVEPLTAFDLIVLTSGTAVEHLLEIASEAEKRQILAMPMLVPSERIARIARDLGAQQAPFVAGGPEDEALLRGVESWRRSMTNGTK